MSIQIAFPLFKMGQYDLTWCAYGLQNSKGVTADPAQSVKQFNKIEVHQHCQLSVNAVFKRKCIATKMTSLETITTCRKCLSIQYTHVLRSEIPHSYIQWVVFITAAIRCISTVFVVLEEKFHTTLSESV